MTRRRPSKTKRLQAGKKYLRTLGVTITKRDGGEYRVNYVDGKEATAYYTDDLDDAIVTGVSMGRERPKRRRSPSRRRPIVRKLKRRPRKRRVYH